MIILQICLFPNRVPRSVTFSLEEHKSRYDDDDDCNGNGIDRQLIWEVIFHFAGGPYLTETSSKMLHFSLWVDSRKLDCFLLAFRVNYFLVANLNYW